MDSITTKPKKTIANFLWGTAFSPWLLIFATLFIIFILLGAKEIWTQEWRWANICHEMLLRHDFFHPYLGGHDYYDKPLLSYWVMIAFSFLFKHLSLWALRLPSAIAGTITVWCTYLLGKKLASRQTGLIAGWLLISTFYFIFWSRVASADMLNVAGIMLALTWYFYRRTKADLFSYTIFFLILAIACLFKGLVAIAVVSIALFPDLLYHNNWKKHLNWALLIGFIIGLIVYLVPFWLSVYINPHHYFENGLFEVYRENILRYFHPFDHKGHYYTYFIYLVIYTFPWIFFLLGALLTLPKRWKTMPAGSRWFVWSLILTVLFFSLSGSRRSYYVLWMVPFALLVTADWIRTSAEHQGKINKTAGIVASIFYLLLVLIFVVLYPVAYSGGGIADFAHTVHQRAEKIKPWKNWHVMFVDTRNKASFYLDSPNLINFQTYEHVTSKAALLQKYITLVERNPDKIIVIGANHLAMIKPYLSNYAIIKTPANFGQQILENQPADAPVALIPLPSKVKTTKAVITTTATVEKSPKAAETKAPQTEKATTPETKATVTPSTETKPTQTQEVSKGSIIAPIEKQTASTSSTQET